MIGRDESWEDVTGDAWALFRGEGRTAPKLRILCDNDVPATFIDGLKDRQHLSLDVRPGSEMGAPIGDDDDLFDFCITHGRVLLTMDHGFWRPRRYPSAHGGRIIVLDVPSKNVEQCVDAFYMLYFALVGPIGNDLADGLRIKLAVDHFVIRGLDAGQPFHWECKWENGRFWKRDVD